jgi:hypothetical protein
VAITVTHEPASPEPRTTEASTRTRTRTDTSALVAAEQPPEACTLARYRPVWGCTGESATEPSAAVTADAIVANTAESAGLQSRVTARPARQPASPARVTLTVTGSPKSTVAAEVEISAVVVAAPAGTATTIGPRRPSANARYRSGRATADVRMCGTSSLAGRRGTRKALG